jgi:hypothetical protein
MTARSKRAKRSKRAGKAAGVAGGKARGRGKQRLRRAGAEGSYGKARTGESRGREVPGDRPGSAADSSAEQVVHARKA